jgi:hypothetical protein
MEFLEIAKKAAQGHRVTKPESALVLESRECFLKAHDRYQLEMKERTGGTDWTESDKQRLCKLVKTYSFIGDKHTPKAQKAMRLINQLRAKRDIELNRLKKALQESAIAYNRHVVTFNDTEVRVNCSRCLGRGMGQYRYIERGVCFKCGRYPTIGLDTPTIF